MAKLADESKLMRIKEAAIALIAENGYGEATISSIASRADVAVGYLYRYYSGKEQLVSDMLDEKIRDLAGQLELVMVSCTTIREVVESVVHYFFCLAESSPDHIRFLYKLINEYRFSILSEQISRIRELCTKLLRIGIETGEISDAFSEEEIFLMTVIYPIGFINIRFKQHFNSTLLGPEDEKKVVALCMSALRG